MKRIVLSLIVLLASCRSQTASLDVKQQSEEESMIAINYLAAVIVDKNGLDGCGFLVQLMDGSSLEVLNLPDSVKVDQLAVWIKYKAGDQMSTCMAGKTVKLIDLKFRKK